jgi:hypothetical protein
MKERNGRIAGESSSLSAMASRGTARRGLAPLIDQHHRRREGPAGPPPPGEGLGSVTGGGANGASAARLQTPRLCTYRESTVNGVSEARTGCPDNADIQFIWESRQFRLQGARE